MSASPRSKRALSPNHERQVRLLIRLLESPRPLSAREIYSSVDEYRERFSPNGDNSSLEKMFERDREALAQTGIEIGTVPDPKAPGDRAQWRYAVVSDAAGGASFDLTAEEVLLVDEATAAWLDPNLRTDARQTYVKLLGQADSGASPADSVPRTVVSTPPVFGALRDAVARSRQIQFDYLKLGGVDPETRHIDALALFSHRGRWLVHGYDHYRAEPRNFLLKRILSDVREVGTHERAQVSPAALIARLEDIAARQAVTVSVKPNSEAEVRLRAWALPVSAEETTDEPAATNADTEQWHELVIHDWDLGLLADELAGMGTAVRVVSPDDVVVGVRQRLARMLRDHREETGSSQQSPAADSAVADSAVEFDASEDADG